MSGRALTHFIRGLVFRVGVIDRWVDPFGVLSRLHDRCPLTAWWKLNAVAETLFPTGVHNSCASIPDALHTSIKFDGRAESLLHLKCNRGNKCQKPLWHNGFCNPHCRQSTFQSTFIKPMGPKACPWTLLFISLWPLSICSSPCTIYTCSEGALLIGEKGKGMRLGITAAIVAWAATAAAAEPPACIAFDRMIDQLERTLSNAAARGAVEDSAPRATVNALEAVEAVLLIQLNLNLALQNKCTPPTHPVGTGSFMSGALECAGSMMRFRAQGISVREIPEVCKMEQWMRERPMPAPVLDLPGSPLDGFTLKSLEGFRSRKE